MTIDPASTVADGIVDAPLSKSQTIVPEIGSTAVRPFEDCNSTRAGCASVAGRIDGDVQLAARGRLICQIVVPDSTSTPQANASASLSTCTITVLPITTGDDDMPRLLLALGNSLPKPRSHCRFPARSRQIKSLLEKNAKTRLPSLAMVGVALHILS